MGKEAFVPQYHGKTMEMVKLRSIEDYEALPLTKWNIKQPSVIEQRENALETGKLYDKSNLKNIFRDKAYFVKLFNSLNLKLCRFSIAGGLDLIILPGVAFTVNGEFCSINYHFVIILSLLSIRKTFGTWNGLL